APQLVVGSTNNNAGINQAVLRPANPLTKTVNGETHQYITEIAPTHGKIGPTKGTNKFFTTGEAITMGSTNILFCDGSARSVVVWGGDHQSENSATSIQTAWPRIWATLPTSRSRVDGARLDPSVA